MKFNSIVLTILFVALLFGGFVFRNQLQQKIVPTPTQVSILTPNAQSTNRPDIPTPDGSWKTYTYTDKELGFAFEYPQFMYIEEGNDSIVTLSTSEQFEKDEFALVIHVNAGTFHPDDEIDSNEQIVKEDLRLSEITQNTGLAVYGTFFGNPPWSYYSVYFHRSGPMFIDFRIRIHSEIDTDLTQKTNTANNYKELTTEILSTLRYTSEY